MASIEASIEAGIEAGIGKPADLEDCAAIANVVMVACLLTRF